MAGLEVVLRKAAAAVLDAGTKRTDRSAALPTTVTQPDLTTKEAKALGVREVMSTFTTTFNSGDVPRVHNISLIAAAVHGSLVRPGQVLDERGHRPAHRGQGLPHRPRDPERRDRGRSGRRGCQAGTTMFNTAFFAGLPVTERATTACTSATTPWGRDATLNWPGTDLKFRNDSPYGIYITSRATPSTPTFSFWSTSRATR